jgi:hypothetical protein
MGERIRHHCLIGVAGINGYKKEELQRLVRGGNSRSVMDGNEGAMIRKVL